MTLGEIFSDGMIFQANKPIRIFGQGKGHVEAAFLGETRSADSDGDSWLLEFPARPYGGPYTLELNLDGERRTIRDVLIGEVILYAGQSNVQFRMDEEVTDPSDYISDDAMRIFVLDRPEDGEPFSPKDGWVKCRKETVDNWSALGYLTALEVRKAGIPAVGVVVCSQGASNIQSWIPETDYIGSPLELPLGACHEDAWAPVYIWNRPGYLYWFMLRKIAPFSFGNVVWYQGESNDSPAEGAIYLSLLELMIRSWRQLFRDPDLPFTVVIIADTRETEGWLLVQKAQAEAEHRIPGVVSVKSGDVCEKEMIHPVTKGGLAKRIAASLRENHRI